MFCFPSCPLNVIEHFAFQPPPPTYTLYYHDKSEKLSFRIDDTFRLQPMHNFVQSNKIKVTYSRTKTSTLVVCMYYAVKPPTRTTILYSHGNSCDLGTVIRVCVWLADAVHCNVLAYDYSGYGRSSGKPTEKQSYLDVEAAYSLLLQKYRCSAEDVVLMGQSLGCAPSLHLASQKRVRGVVIQSGFTSALNVPFPRREHRPMCFDAFENIKKIKKVTSPLLVIHGTEDELIGLSQGKALYKNCPCSVEPLWIVGAGHNDIENHTEFLERLQRFVAKELPKLSDPQPISGRIFLNLGLHRI